MQKRLIFSLKIWHRAALFIPNGIGHFRLIRILSHPQSAQFALAHPEIFHKYLKTYLSLNIFAKTRLRIVTSHYAYLQKMICPKFLDIISQSPIELWREDINGISFVIQLGYPTDAESEGDLCFFQK
jgi:uncharacterized protein VirK/YbjX